MFIKTAASLFAAIIAYGSGPAAAADARLNQIQVVGSHNSYRLAPEPGVMKLIEATQPKLAKSLAYTHRPLGEQFSRLGVRQIELDVYADPKGGLYADPLSRRTLRKMKRDPGAELDPKGLLKEPGMKVLHVPDVDFRTTAPTFVDALKQVRAWSKAHPRHVPLFILVELKDETHPGLTKPSPFDGEALDALEAEIKGVFSTGEMVTPDDVRGSASTLPEALKARGWPALDSVRGKVIFALDNEDAIRDRYLEGHPALKGRVMFASVAETHPAAAWMKVNDPVGDFSRIQRLVKEGFLVRTRADADTVEARANDPRRREKALASGAQFVSTDYAEPDAGLSAYRVRLPGGVVARANPISGGGVPEGVDLEAADSRP